MKSGRKSGVFEKVRALVINHCWDEINDYLQHNPGLKKKYKRALVLEVIKKTIPTDINLTGKLDVENIMSLKLDDKQFNDILNAYVNRKSKKGSVVKKDIQ